MEIYFDFSSIRVSEFNTIARASSTFSTVGQVIEAIDTLQRFTTTSMRDLQFSDLISTLAQAYIILQNNMWIWLQEK